MSAPEEVRHRQVVEEAAFWHARIASRETSESQRRALASWLNESPERADILAAMGQMVQALPVLGRAVDEESAPEQFDGLLPMLDDARAVAAKLSKRRPSRPWLRPNALAASVMLTVMLAVFLLSGRPTPAEQFVHETAIAARETIDLPDGSSVVLNADSRLLVTFTEQERRLVLRRGEIFIDVAEDPVRPFAVAVNGNLLTAVGTEFKVRFRERPAQLTVTEGRVAVTRRDDRSPPLEVRASQVLALEAGSAPVDLGPHALRSASAWRDGWLQFDEAPLATVLGDLEPWIEKRVVMLSQSSEELTISGSYDVENAEALLLALESLLPVTVTVDDDRILIEDDPVRR